MAFLIKLVLFVVYLAVMIIILRLMDFATWQAPPDDLMAMHSARLKAILEQRGVEYAHLYEKRELASLIEATGPVSNEELAILQKSVSEETPVANFTSDLHFCEQVFDARDSMWLIEIIVEQALITDKVWHAIRKKLSKFGVKFGQFHCTHYMRFCNLKGWTSSRLTLATPSHDNKETTLCNPITYTYTHTIESNAIFKWLKRKVNEGLTVVADTDQLTQNWLQFPELLSPEVRVLYVSTYTNVPFCLSSLAFRYAGRVKMGIVNADSDNGKAMIETLDVTTLPSYLIITRQMVYDYGHRRGDHITYNAFDFLLTSVYPSMNDVLKMSLIFTNLLVCFEVCLKEGHGFKILVHLVYVACKYNCVHIFAWMVTWILMKLHFVETVISITLLPMRKLILSPNFSMPRNDIVYCYNNIAFSFTMLACMMTFIFLAKHNTTPGTTQANTVLEEDNNFELNEVQNRELETEERQLLVVNERESSGHVLERQTPPGASVRQHRVYATAHILITGGAEQQIQATALGETENRPRRNASDIPMEMRFRQNEPVLVVDGMYIQFVGVSYEYIRCLPVWEHQLEVTCKGYCRMKDKDVNNSHIWKSTVVDTLGTPCNISGVSSVQNINVMRHAPGGFTVDSSCVICIEDYEKLVILRGLPCKHVFHDACVLNWLLNETSNRLCPICRYPSYRYEEINIDLQIDTDKFCQMFDSNDED